MNGIEGIGWEGRRVTPRPAARPRAALAPEQIILSIAVAAPLLGAFTHPLLCECAGMALAALVTLRYIAADVRALRAWAGE
jgi:hypothetical protein